MTISPVAPSALPAGTSAGTSAAAAGLGALFAGFLCAGTAAPGSTGNPAVVPTTDVLGDPTADLPGDAAVTDADTDADQLVDCDELGESGRETSVPTSSVELT